MNPMTATPAILLCVRTDRRFCVRLPVAVGFAGHAFNRPLRQAAYGC